MYPDKIGMGSKGCLKENPVLTAVSGSAQHVHYEVAEVIPQIDEKIGGEVLRVNDFLKFAKDKEEADRIKDSFKDLVCVDIEDPESVAFKESMKLYEYAFPNPDERESMELIAKRVKTMKEMPPEIKERYGDRRFHAIAIMNKKNQAVGYAQFSVLPFGDDKNEVVVFGQYIAAADCDFMKERYGSYEHFRRKGLYSALGILAPLIAERDADKMGYKNGYVGAFGESEMVGQAEDPDDIRFTEIRLNIHSVLGGKAIMLELENGGLINPHMCPKLSEDSNPIQLLMLYRPKDYLSQPSGDTVEMDKETVQKLEGALLDSLQADGFDSDSIEEARRIFENKMSIAKHALLMPVYEVPRMTDIAKNDPLLAKQIERDYGCSVEEHAANVEKALSEPANINAPIRGL